MSNEATILRIRAQVENLEGLNRARSAVRNFATESKAASNDLDKLRSLFKELGSESVRSVNNLKNYRTGLDALRQSAQIGSTTFNELTAEIKQLDIELGTLQGKQAQVASGFNKIASSANAAATATRRQFDLSGARAGFGQMTFAGGERRTIRDTTQYAQPIGPTPIDYAGVNRGLTQAVQAEQQLTELSRRARQERLLAAEKYNALELAADEKKWREELRIQQQGSDRALADFDRRLANRGKRRANLQRIGQTAGAVAAAGVFGGPEGLIGAGIGAFGGPGGALAGGAIGATVGSIRQAIGETAKYTAELQLLRIALGGVSTSSKDYDNNLQAVDRLSQRFLIPLKDTTEQYTKLQASVQGAGLGSKQTETAFKGIAAAIIATGGSTQDLNSALLATSQVFSKGKVSAEELRGQIGERLAGAFTIFAASIGKTPQQLDKALKDGEVTLANFLTFTEELFKRYGKTADIIAEAPQNAGKRLTLALDNITVQIGRFAGPIGAAFQSIATNIVNGLAPAFEAFANLLDLPKVAAKERLPQIDRQIKAAQKQIDTYRLGEGMPGGRLAFTIPRQLQETQLKALQGERKLIQVTLASAGSGVNRNTARVGDMVGGGEKSNKAAEKAAEKAAKQAAEEALRIKNSLGDIALERDLKKQIYNIENKIFEANLRNDKETAIRLQGQIKLVQISAAAARLEYDKITPIQKQEKIQSLMQDAAIAQRDTQQQLILNQVALAKQAEAAIRPMIDENELMQAKLEGTEREYKTRKLIEQIMNNNPALQRKDVVEIVAKNQALQEQLTQAEQLKAVYSDIGMSIKSGLVDAVQSAIDGTKSLGEVASNVLGNIANKILDVAINMALFGVMSGTGTGGGLLGGLFKKNANGNVFAQNGIVPFANGGIVDRPMMFPFAKGIGLMGEAGPEAIMPLKRGADGKLGVAGGGGGTSVTVNVDASGSSVQGNNGQSAALGRAIAASVQAELVKQKRPGGLLA